MDGITETSIRFLTLQNKNTVSAMLPLPRIEPYGLPRTAIKRFVDSIALSYVCIGCEIRIGDERVSISLFRKKFLTVVGAFFFDGMAGYQRVKK